MTVAAAPDLTGAPFVFPVQKRGSISCRTRGRRTGESAAHAGESGPDLAPLTPVVVPASFLAASEPRRCKHAHKAGSPPPDLPATDESADDDTPINDPTGTSELAPSQPPTDN